MTLRFLLLSLAANTICTTGGENEMRKCGMAISNADDCWVFLECLAFGRCDNALIVH
jgi:hypothetical protein